MAGTIVADDIQHSTAGSVGTEYVVRGTGKVNLNMDNSMAARDSLNISSITNLGGSGENYYNFSTSFSALDYVAHGTNSDDSAANRGMNVQNTWTSGQQTTGRVRMNTYPGADPTYVGITCFGDLA